MLNRLLGREDERPPGEVPPGEPRESASTDTGAPLADGLARSRSGWRERMSSLFGPADITEETWTELEERLVQADVGPRTAAELVDQTRAVARDARVHRGEDLPRALRKVMVRQLEAAAAEPLAAANAAPTVILVIGVNGSGKTTTIAKLAHRFHAAGRRTVLVAADTFRAAAIDQLQEWGRRVGVEVIAGSPGADPAAVVFDGLSSRTARAADIVIVDTAGRLQTQSNLMAELAKVARVCARVVEGAPHDTLLVIDATTGQNGLSQAQQFTASAQVTALVLAKLDSSAKGGVAFAIQRELGIPIALVGTGEGLADLADFSAEEYVDALLGVQGGA